MYVELGTLRQSSNTQISLFIFSYFVLPILYAWQVSWSMKGQLHLKNVIKIDLHRSVPLILLSISNRIMPINQIMIYDFPKIP